MSGENLLFLRLKQEFLSQNISVIHDIADVYVCVILSVSIRPKYQVPKQKSFQGKKAKCTHIKWNLYEFKSHSVHVQVSSYSVQFKLVLLVEVEPGVHKARRNLTTASNFLVSDTKRKWLKDKDLSITVPPVSEKSSFHEHRFDFMCFVELQTPSTTARQKVALMCLGSLEDWEDSLSM